MSPSSPRPKYLTIKINTLDPNLLEGLDNWLCLGLISDEQVKQISYDYLSCVLPESIIEGKQTEISVSQGVKVETQKSLQPSFLTTIWQSLKDELSVRWFLFLGVFLVVLSSGVLAATQWETFPPVAQYGVLFTYTLIFWGVARYTQTQENLRLTSQTLKIISLLLIPVNFWAMDSFGLWGNIGEGIIGAIAAIILTIIAFISYSFQNKIFLLINFLILSYLHIGWSINGLDVIAIYISMMGTTINLRWNKNHFQKLSNRSFIIYGLAILLIRGIFVTHINISSLGLAIGICGWLLATEALILYPNFLARNTNIKNIQSPAIKGLEFFGITLLFFSWLVTIQSIPWQGILISCLALHFYQQRLKQFWLKIDLFAIFIIGLQALISLRNIIPSQVKQDALNLSIQVAQSQDFPYTVYGITLFPYVIFWVWLNQWLYHQEKKQLTFFGEWLTLGLGILLTCISWMNPTWRSLNLLLSTITLIYVTQYCLPLQSPLFYLSHTFSILTIITTIDWWFPNLNYVNWAIICLGFMVAEWQIGIRRFQDKKILRFASKKYRQKNNYTNLDKKYFYYWYSTCNFFGFIFATISYILLAENNRILNNNPVWGLLWLITPITLTIVANQSPLRYRKSISTLSIIALVLSQGLTLEFPIIREISLGIATALMFVNIRYIRNLIAAIIHIGFALSFIIALFWDKISPTNGLLVSGFIIFSLWLLHNFCISRQSKLFQIYAQATDNWSIVLTAIELWALTILSFDFSNTFFSPEIGTFFAPLIIIAALIYRYWQHPYNWTIYVFAWTIEIATLQGIRLFQGTLLDLAIINIFLALITLGLTHWLSQRFSYLASLISWQFLPLLYAILAIYWRLNYFTSYTGLLVLGGAITALGVGNRRQQLKEISYSGVALISFGIYELVIYQLSLSQGGSPADGLTILALVTAIIALSYRIFAWFLSSQNKTNFFNLTVKEITITAHIHWALASILKLLTAGVAISTNPKLTFISIAISFILAFYALIQARNPELNKSARNDWWVYVGMVEIIGTIIYARLIWTQLGLLDPIRVILACVVALIIYQMPWNNFGWHTKPWHRTAIVIPALMTLTTTQETSYFTFLFSLITVAAFYIRIAIKQNNIRWTYLSLGFIDWAVARSLVQFELVNLLNYVSIFSLSILYIAQFDPNLKEPFNRKNRHYLRIFASSLICVIALIFHSDTGIIPAVISLLFIFAGIGLQIRAFLFVGTITFIFNGFYQLVILITEYAMSKWIIGLITGLILISFAALFEQKREQITNIIQKWFDQLTRWQ